MSQQLRSRGGQLITVRNADAAKRWEARGYTLVVEDDKPKRTAAARKTSDKGDGKS